MRLLGDGFPRAKLSPDDEKIVPYWLIYIDDERTPRAKMIATGTLDGLRVTVTRELERHGIRWSRAKMVHSQTSVSYSFPKENP